MFTRVLAVWGTFVGSLVSRARSSCVQSLPVTNQLGWSFIHWMSTAGRTWRSQRFLPNDWMRGILWVIL